MRPRHNPIGLDVSRTGRLLHRAFDEQLVAAGCSLPVWLILIALKGGDHTMQRDLATSIGIEDATLTHHLNRMARDGLIERHRDPANRRNQVVTLTDSGETLFGSLLTTVTAFDRRVRAGFSATELDTLRQLLARLRTNLEQDAAR
jgi:MarR family transcriptional regulator, transcriptional regulator for hemolysin